MFAVAGLIAFVGLDGVGDRVGWGLGAADVGDDAQAACVQDEGFDRAVSGFDGDFAGEVCPAKGDVDGVFAGGEFDGRGGFTVGCDEFGFAVAFGFAGEDAPDETLVDALAVRGQEGFEADGCGCGCV